MTEDRYQEERFLDSRIEQLEGELRRLRRCLLAAVVAISGVGLVALGPVNDGAQEFETIRAERIDLVEADGTRRMVLSNEERFPNPVLDGEEFQRSINPAGLVLYDRSGSEMGGIAALDPEGPARWTALIFDYENSEAIGLSTRTRGEGGYGASLTIADRIPLEADIREVGTSGTARVDIQNEDGDAAIVLSDSDGNPRLRLFVDAEGRTGIEMLDPDGEVVSRLGPGDGA